MAKVYQMKLIKQKLGKYSKVMGYDETMLDETIEVQPEEECVKDDVKTAALEVMDVVDIPKKDGESEEVVVVETPNPEDTTIKVQSTETGVTADVPVEVFSKATKISKAKIKAYSEAEEAGKKEDEKPEDKPAEEPKPEDKPAEEPAKEDEKKPEGEVATASEETPAEEEKKPEEDKPKDEPKAEEEKPEEKKDEGNPEGEEVAELETKSLAISLSSGKVYAYSEGDEDEVPKEGEVAEIVTEDGELDTVANLKDYCGEEATYALFKKKSDLEKHFEQRAKEKKRTAALQEKARENARKKAEKEAKRIEANKWQTEGKGRNLFQKGADLIRGRDAEAMERMAKAGITREDAKRLGKKGSFTAKMVKKMPRLGIVALANAGHGAAYLKDLYGKLGGLAGIAAKRAQFDQMVRQAHGNDPEEIKKVSDKLIKVAADEGQLDKVAEVKEEYKEKLAAASKMVAVYSKFKYVGAPICLGVYSEETNEIVEEAQEAKAEDEAKKAEAAAEVAENAAEVKQPEDTKKLPIVIEKVDNGYNITANGETKVADDVKSVCNIISELLEETKMDAFSKLQNAFRSNLLI